MLIGLGSANGTFFKDQRVKEHILNNEEIFSISKYRIAYKDQAASLNIKYDNQKIGNTILMRKPEQVVSGLPVIDKTSFSIDNINSATLLGEIEALRKKAETLTRIYELNAMLGAVFRLEDIFIKVSEMLFRVTPADRFLVMLKDAASGQLTPFITDFRRRAKLRTGISFSGSEIMVSQTVVDRVVSEQVSLLSCDTQADVGLASAKSIIMQNIHSVMCAPLLGGAGLLGVIYVDCQQVMHMFTEDDLDLLNAIAGATSIAVDNAISHERLVREELARAKYSRFMPRHVVEEILANPNALSLGGKNADVTILFSDVRGFTSMSENLPPETVVQILNEYFSDMAPIVFEHTGLLDKYMGDGLMALFGVPLTSEHSAVNAVSAAVAMQRRMNIVNQSLRERGLSEIAIGIGINTGTATVGYIGSEEKTDYTAIGDAVNLAARLEKEAQAGQIIISHATLQEIGSRFLVRPSGRGEVKVKGKKEPVQVYEVIWNEAERTTHTGSDVGVYKER
jgi:adenylate cyclase